MKSSQQYFNLSDNSDNERYSNKRNRSGHQQDQKVSKQGKGERQSYQSFNQFQQLMESPNAYLALSDSSDDERSTSKRMASRYRKISKQNSKGTKEQYENQKSQNHHNSHHNHHKDIQENHDHKSHQKKQEHQHKHHSHRKSSNDGKREQQININSDLNQVKAQQETFKDSSIQYSSNHQIQKSPSDSTSTNIDDASEQPQKINYSLHLNAFNSVLAPEEMKNLTFEDSRHYKVIGDTRIFYTRSGNLSQKIKEIHNTKEEQERLEFLEEKRKQQELLKNISESKSSETNKEEKMDDEQEENYKDLFEYDKNNRYFLQEQKQQMTCRRCKQQGHFERMCMLEVKDVCNNCLGDHFARQCQQKICYSCSQFGHASANCPKQNSQKCSRCQKPGHIKADCGAIFLNNYSRYKQNAPFNGGIEEEWKKTDDQKIKCMVCHKKGHLNCKNDYQKIRDDIYGNKFQERIQKLRRREEEAKFQGKIINFHYSEESEDSYDSHLASLSLSPRSQSYEERSNEKKRNSKKKQKKQSDHHHHSNSHQSHSHSKHHSHHGHHSQHGSHRHHHSHHDESRHHHHHDSHRHYRSDKHRRYDEDIQIHVDDDKHYKLKKQIRKESKRYK
ncbi:hypothetical protein ABPG72_010816 [Tetrahymena utriculariae]